MEFTVDNIAAVVIVGVVVLDKSISMLKSRGIDLQTMAKQIDSLDKLHAVTDQDGVPIWYFRRSLDEILLKLVQYLEKMDRRQEIDAERVKKHDKVMESLAISLEHMRKE